MYSLNINRINLKEENLKMNIKIMSEYTKFLESTESANKEENV